MALEQIIGNNLKKARLQKKVTQAQMAQKLRILQPAYARYESGKVQLNYEQIQTVCDILEITPDFLWGYVDEYGEPIKKDSLT